MIDIKLILENPREIEAKLAKKGCVVNFDPLIKLSERRKELIQGNVRQDDFIDVWENKFQWFRDLDKLKSKECENCEDWKYCRGDSLHTWDFKNQKPKICYKKNLKEE